MLKSLRIGVVGGGTVGAATAAAWGGHAESVLVHDMRPERANALLREVLRCNLVFVCLPTPQREGSLECDVSTVEGFFKRVQVLSLNGGRDVNWVLKSTVPIGFTRRMAGECKLPNLVHSPEFLTARTAVEDATNPTRNIIGVPNEQPNEGLAVLGTACLARWPNVPLLKMTSDESEAVKLAQNAFSAVKVAWFNELHQLCRERGLDFEVVRAALLAGGWVNPMHTQVPGPDGKFGFGPDGPSACLPKDIANWISCFSGECPVSRGALERNLADRGVSCPLTRSSTTDR